MRDTLILRKFHDFNDQGFWKAFKEFKERGITKKIIDTQKKSKDRRRIGNNNLVKISLRVYLFIIFYRVLGNNRIYRNRFNITIYRREIRKRKLNPERESRDSRIINTRNIKIIMREITFQDTNKTRQDTNKKINNKRMSLWKIE